MRATDAPPPTPAPPSSFAGGHEGVLLVEDDSALLTLGTEALTELGYRVFAARTGAEALRLFEARESEIQIVVTDVVMPEMGGRELSEKITRRNPETRVLFVSGYTKDSVLREGIEGSELAFLSKPYTPIQLARSVRETLDATTALSPERRRS